MAKTYIDTVKYLVYAEMEVDGLVDKPDVVGAIFGQTEGLLGDDLDLRELQKNGRIGRIEVELNGRGGKTYGQVKIPSSLDMVETSIIAASLEVVDRIGPCDGRVSVKRIEDTRNQKRKILVDRAKNLLKNMLNTEIPDSREISDQVRDQVKSAEIVEYGPEKLSCGPNIDKFEELILVEGRADVINLLKNDMSNVVAIGGARVTKSIVELSKGKEITVFLDGDRGGDIILNELVQGGVEIDFVARAPVGKEVEELTRKEMIKVLRNKIPYEQIEGQKSKPFAQPYQTRRFVAEQPAIVGAKAPEERPDSQMMQRMERVEAQIAQRLEKAERPEPQALQRMERAETQIMQRREPVREMPHETPKEVKEERREIRRPVSSASVQPIFERIQQIIKPHEDELEFEKPGAKDEKTAQLTLDAKPEAVKKSQEELLADLNELSNTLKARVYSGEGALIKEVPVRDVIKTIEEQDNVGTVVFDGIITQRLVDIAHQRGVKSVIGIKVGNVSKKPEGLQIITKNK